MDEKRLFVTGATGFVGSHFIDHALRAGHMVRAWRRDGAKPVIPLRQEPEWVPWRLGDRDDGYFRDIDTLVHLASVGVPPKPSTFEEAMQFNLFDALDTWMRAKDAGVSRVVIAGSALEYGLSFQRYDPMPADAPLDPMGTYAISKAASSIAARKFAVQQNVELAYVRFFHLYGEGQHERNFYPALCSAATEGRDFAMTSGQQVRDFSHVSSAAECLLDLATAARLHAGKPAFLNHGSGLSRTLAEYATAWWQELEARGKLQIGGLPDRPNEIPSMRPKL